MRRTISDGKPVLMEDCQEKDGYQDYFSQNERPMRLSFRTSNSKNVVRVSVHDCRSYFKCLDYAAEKKWASFTCEKCPHFLGLKKMDKALTAI